MRFTRWNVVAVAMVLATAACGGDAGEDVADEPTMQEPAATEPAPAAPGGQQALGPAPEGATDQQVQEGQTIFTGVGNCYTCHGMDARGTQLAPNLTDSEWLNISEGSWDEIQQNIRNGVPQPVQHPAPMPPMGGAQLSDAQIQAVAAYVYAISHGS